MYFLLLFAVMPAFTTVFRHSHLSYVNAGRVMEPLRIGVAAFRAQPRHASHPCRKSGSEVMRAEECIHEAMMGLVPPLVTDRIAVINELPD